MAHEISINKISGKEEAYYADKPAWHGLGTVVTGARTSEEVINLAGLNWKVEQQPLFTESLLSDGTLVKSKLTTHQANVRGDTGDLLGVVGKNWKPFQNADAFAFVDSLVEEGKITYESAGVLRGGKIVWLLAKLESDGKRISIAGDEHHRYFFVYVGHDGTRSIKFIPTDVRVVCWNTASMAEKMAEKTFTIHHNAASMDNRLKMLHDTISASHVKFDNLMEIYENIQRLPATTENMNEFYTKWHPVVETPLGATEFLAEEIRKKNLKRDNLIEKIENTLITDSTCNTKAAHGTMYGAYNAVTRYFDHGRKSRSRETKFDMAMFGFAAKEKKAALKAVTELIAV